MGTTLSAAMLRNKKNSRFQTDMMEQWVTDSFYSSFPSFKNQDLNGNKLMNDRREDYRKYLAEVRQYFSVKLNWIVMKFRV